MEVILLSRFLSMEFKFRTAIFLVYEFLFDYHTPKFDAKR